MQATPPIFTIGEMIATGSVAVIVVGWLVGTIAGLLKHDRNVVTKQEDESKRQIVALWKSQDEIRTELNDARRELAVINDRVQSSLPDQKHWDMKFESFRIHLEKKLDAVLEKLHDTQIQLTRITPGE